MSETYVAQIVGAVIISGSFVPNSVDDVLAVIMTI